MKKFLWVLLILIVIFGGIFGWKIFVKYKTEQFMAQRQTPAVYVSAMQAGKQIWQPSLEAVGNVRAIQGIQVTGEVPGIITKIHFQSGQEVQKGELLVELDLEEDLAVLNRLQADKDLARIQLGRMKRLVQQKMAPQSELDQAEARYKKAKAEVMRQEAFIEKKKIRAPFNGRLGIRQVDFGQYLQPGSPVVGLQYLSPIYVDFSLPQQYVQSVHLDQEMFLQLDAWPKRKFKGKITAIEPEIRKSSRNFSIQATLDNKEKLLQPGMFGNVSLQLPGKKELVTLPKTAIKFNPYGEVVFLLKDTGKKQDGQSVYTASQQFVKTGDTRGNQVAVLQGVSAGDHVVTAGHHKLQTGSKVLINNSIQPSMEIAPQVENK